MKPNTQSHVLLVDDDPQVREVFQEVFVANGFECQTAQNGREGLDLFEKRRPPLVVTDIKMPVMDGLRLLKEVRALDSDVAVIVLTGVEDVKTAIESLKAGAYDFILKPVDIDALMIATDRALERRALLIERRDYQALLERRVEEATRDLTRTLSELQDTYRATLEALGSALDTRDIGSQAHSRRVLGDTLAIAKAYGVPEAALPAIRHGVLLHDIGKIGIPDAILLKPGPLTSEEWTIMRQHPTLGKRLLQHIPFLQDAVPIVYHHHERWDGSGYPLGLLGEAIPLGARLFAVADAFDAMTFDRPYSRAISFEAARMEITRCAGSHFDPAVVEAFLSVPDSVFRRIRDESVDGLLTADPDPNSTPA